MIGERDGSIYEVDSVLSEAVSQRLARVAILFGEDRPEQVSPVLTRLLAKSTRSNFRPQRVEHYEMAGYGTVQTFAKLLGEKEAAELFTLTLNEEKAADKKLSLLAKSINVKAKAEKPPASVKTAVKESAKLPVKIPSGGQREVQGIESNMEAKQSQPE